MTYRCIGKHRIRQHADSIAILVQCMNESEVPSNPNKPEWGWLCPTCSSEKPQETPAAEEKFNVGAMQCDVEEYKDQIESGFMAGIHSSKEED